MAKCKECGTQISNSTVSQLCRTCAQKASIPKREATCMKRYGVKNVMQKKEFVDKISESMMKKYGAKCPMEVPELKEKIRKTNTQRYGVPYYVLTDDYVEHNQSCISKINKKFAQKLEDAGLQVKLEKVVEDKHYDIHIVGTNILIEINPTYTHNVIGSHWDEKGTPKDYHKMKTAIGVANGYRVIHVWDWDDANKIIEMVKPKEKIYARKCKIQEVSNSEYQKFTEKYHLQGATTSLEFCLGLYYKDELIQIMAWGKPEVSTKFQHEMLRLCTKFGYAAVGGAERLFKHSLRRLQDESIVAYCDLSKFSGEVYKKLSMNLVALQNPQEIWSKGRERILSTTLNTLGYSQLFETNYDENISNESFMIEHGWMPLYDCGHAVYTLHAETATNDINSTTSDADIKEYQAIAAKARKPKIKIKQCEFCGKGFVQKAHNQIYCKGPHMRICPACGKEYEETNVENLKRPPHACSYPCRVIRTQRTSLEKYGCTAPGNNPEARKKAKAKMVEKFGAEYTLQSKELVERVKNTMKEKYGVENAACIKSAQAKRKATFEKKGDTLIFYQEPRVNVINAKDLQVFRLDIEYANDWLNLYHPFKAPKGTVLALGLCDENQTYCMMTFKKSRNKNYVAELSRLWMLPTYNVVDGYQVLSQQASEFGISSIVAYVNLSFENVNDYKSIGMKYLRTNQRTKWWLRNNELVSDASRRQKGLSHHEMIFNGYGIAYDCGIEVYEFVE